MQKIDERSLELKPEEYFDYCKNNKNIRGVWVITDKQSIFYSQILNNDYRTHDDIYHIYILPILLCTYFYQLHYKLSNLANMD